MTRLSDRALVSFNAWFSSRAGVWQTLIAVVVIVIVERLFPRLDPSGYWILYALTLYSGITQPALACVGRESADALIAMQADHADLLRAIHDLTAQQHATLAQIQASEAREVEELAAIEHELEGRGS